MTTKIPSTLSTVIDALNDFSVCGAQLATRPESFSPGNLSKRMLIRYAESGKWKAFADLDYIELRLNLERAGFSPVSKSRIKDCARLVALQTEILESADLP